MLDLEVTLDLGFGWEPFGGPEGRQNIVIGEGSTLVADIMAGTGGCRPSSELGQVRSPNRGTGAGVIGRGRRWYKSLRVVG